MQVLVGVVPVFVSVSLVGRSCVVGPAVVAVVVSDECLLLVVEVVVCQSVDGCGIPLGGVVVLVVRPVGVEMSEFRV